MRLISTKEAAEILGISRRAVQKKAAKGQLPVVEYRIVRGKRAPFFDEEQIKRIAFNNGELDCEPITANLTANCEPITANLTANCEPTNDTPKIKENTDRDGNNSENNEGGMHSQLSANYQVKNEYRVHRENGVKTTTSENNSKITKKRGLSARLSAQNDQKMEFVSAQNGYEFEFDDGEFWLEIEECAYLLGVHKTTIRRKIRNNEFKKIRKISAQNREGFKYQIAVSSLPVAAQRRFFEKSRVKEEIMRQIIDLPANPTDEDIRKANIVIEAKRVPNGAKKSFWYEQVAKKYGVSVQTVYRFLQMHKEARLFEKPRTRGKTISDFGVVIRSWDKEAAVFAIGLAMTNRFNRRKMKDLYSDVCVEASKHDWKVGSYSSFCRLIAKAIKETPHEILRDKGERGLEVSVTPKIRRDFTQYKPFELLVGDQHKFDFLCYDDNMNEIWLEGYAFEDMRTGLVFGSVCFKHYNQYVITEALGEAMRYGVVENLYFDNGKPEKSLHIRRVFARLKQYGTNIDEHITNAIVKRSWSKPIEGLFGKIDRSLRSRGLPGYIKRQLDDSEVNDEVVKELRRQKRKGELLHYRELIEEIAAVFDEWNWHIYTNRQTRCDNGLSPWDIYKNEATRVVLGDDVLKWILLPEPRQKIKVRNSKIAFVHPFFGKLEFFDPRLSSLVGKTVDVRYEPFESDVAYAITDEKEVIACQRWGLTNPKNEIEVSQKIKIQKAIIRHWKEIQDRYKRKVEQYIKDVNTIQGVVRESALARSARGEIKRLETARKVKKETLKNIYEVIINTNR